MSISDANGPIRKGLGYLAIKLEYAMNYGGNGTQGIGTIGKGTWNTGAQDVGLDLPGPYPPGRRRRC